MINPLFKYCGYKCKLHDDNDNEKNKHTNTFSFDKNNDSVIKNQYPCTCCNNGNSCNKSVCNLYNYNARNGYLYLIANINPFREL